MMVAERATAPVPTTPLSAKQNQHDDSITPEPLVCALCGSLEGLYFASAGAVCTTCMGCVVSVACDVWPGQIGYSEEFERTVLM